MSAGPCHPYDDPCGGPGGPCRNHGGAVLPSLSQDEWLEIRKAAMQWVEQVQHGQPGPEPLRQMVREVIETHVQKRLGMVRAVLSKHTCTGCFSEDHHCGDPKCDLWREVRDAALGLVSVRCRHGNLVVESQGAAKCGCMIIDKAIHPCRGCPPTCGNCL